MSIQRSPPEFHPFSPLSSPYITRFASPPLPISCPQLPNTIYSQKVYGDSEITMAN